MINSNKIYSSQKTRLLESILNNAKSVWPGIQNSKWYENLPTAIRRAPSILGTTLPAVANLFDALTIVQVQRMSLIEAHCAFLELLKKADSYGAGASSGYLLMNYYSYQLLCIKEAGYQEAVRRKEIS